MSTHGRDSHDSGSPDVTARVMQRLGYENASASRVRELRRRTAVVRVLQGVIVLSAVVLGGLWWFDGTVPSQRGPAVVDSLRGSLTRGTSELHGFFAAMPRLPSLEAQAIADGAAFGSRIGTQVGPQAELPSASLENAPQVRSY